MQQRLGLALALSVMLLGAPVRAQEDTLPAQIEAYLAGRDAQAFSAAVLVVQDGVVLVRNGYGLADDATGTPFSADTVVDAGSIAKPLTATAILRLQDQGLLRVTDTLADYFADVPSEKAGITIHQLLTHTSGLGNHVEDDLAPMSRDEAQALIFAQRLMFTPGARYEYSNAGYTLLSIVVEQISGQLFTEAMHSLVFAPAGMTSTGFYGEAQWQNRTVANGYLNGEDQGSPATWPGPYYGVLGNGGVLTTVDDLYRLWTQLRDGSLLAPATADAMFAPHVQEEPGLAYGYGWSVQDTAHGQRVFHSGGGIGGNSMLSVHTERALTVIVQGNRIVYRTVFGVPCSVSLPANEISAQLTANIFASDFTAQPRRTLSVC